VHCRVHWHGVLNAYATRHMGVLGEKEGVAADYLAEAPAGRVLAQGAVASNLPFSVDEGERPARADGGGALSVLCRARGDGGAVV
jgi:hypothetical protein